MFPRFLRITAALFLVLSVASCSDPRSAAPALAPAATATVAANRTVAESSPAEPTSIVIYSQPPKPGGGLIPASWRDPDGSETDRFVWDNIGFANAQTISEVRWRGGYDPAKGGSGGPVRDFTIEIYQSIQIGRAHV